MDGRICGTSGDKLPDCGQHLLPEKPLCVNFCHGTHVEARFHQTKDQKGSPRRENDSR